MGMVGAGALIAGGSIYAASQQSDAVGEAAAAQSAASMSAAQAQVEAATIAAEGVFGAAWLGAEAQTESTSMSVQAQREAMVLQYDAIMKQIEFAKQTYAQNKEILRPYVNIGEKALRQLQWKIEQGPGDYKKSPGYEFRMAEGNKNILANAAATGGLASGRTLKALQEYGQNYASGEYQNFLANYYQSLAPYQWMSSVGENAAAGTGNAAINASQQVGGAYSALANAYWQQGSTLAGIYGAQAGNLSNIYSNMGSGLAGIYQNRGNAMAQNFMNQGNIAAQASIGQANAWTSGINNAMSGLATFYGMQG